jgi:hypothetical protein
MYTVLRVDDGPVGLKDFLRRVGQLGSPTLFAGHQGGCGGRAGGGGKELASVHVSSFLGEDRVPRALRLREAPSALQTHHHDFRV